MSATKHTHRGTCQICGSLQAVNNKTGLLAKHGYTTKWGFFSGTCTGSDELPFEVSCALIEAAIARATEKAQSETERAAIERARTGLDGYISHYVKGEYNGRRYVGGHYVTLPATFAETFKAFADGGAGGYWKVSATAEWKGNAVEQKDLGYSQRAAKLAARSREDHAKAIDAVIARIREYVEWQAARVAAWKPGELVAVAP